MSGLPQKAGEMDTSLWMIPFADLMSTMVILFLALFAYSYSSKSPEYARAVSKIESDMAQEAPAAEKRLIEAELAVELKKDLEGLALKDFGMRVTSRYIHITLPAPVLFEEGSARLSAPARELLGKMARVFAKLPNPVLVKGHTDDVRIAGGRYKTNWELSAARAFSVIDFFIRSGMRADRFRAHGYGEFRPVASNETAEGRARNRRIEISLLRELRQEEQ